MERRVKRKKRWLPVLAVCVLLYLIVGATAPFAVYREVSEETRTSFDAQAYLEGKESPDRAMLLETNQSALEERIRLFSAAKERIILTTFDMRDGESTRDLLAVLLHKADEGVSIRMIVDGFSAMIHMGADPLFQAFSAHPNVQLKVYNPVNLLTPWKTQGRMHDKYVIVDDIGVITGGRNMFDYFIGSYDTENPSYDREVLIYNEGWERPSESDSVLYDMERYFEAMWAQKDCSDYFDEEALLEKKAVAKEAEALRERYEQLTKEYPELFLPADYEAMTVPTQGVYLLSNPTTIYGKEPVLLYQLTELMAHAKERVILHTPYLVCNDYMYERLEAVRGSVPDLTLVMNSVANGDNFMASSDYLYNKKRVVRMEIPIYEYDGGYSYHGKSAVIDGEISVIGSFNMDLRSAYGDTEVMLVIHSRELTEELAGYMAGFQADCRRVIDATAYEVPEGLTVERVPPMRMVLMRIVGFVMQGFRYLV